MAHGVIIRIGSTAARRRAVFADIARPSMAITVTPRELVKYDDTQHRRSKTCSGCGASTYDYANHSYSYGSWVSDSETQHKRTKTCSACGDSGYEYADHIDTNGDGKCDNRGATVSLTVTWDAGSNGGTIDGQAAYRETVSRTASRRFPHAPGQKGHTFKGWYTAGSGSASDTVTSSRPAQRSPCSSLPTAIQ